MKVSVFTPTNNTKWLMDAYRSLLKQTYGNWEWIIQPNHDSDVIKISDEIAGDLDVKVLPFTKSDGVGCMKKLCCLKATGDILVELDHDDWLVPTALQEIVAAFNTHGEPGFVYSDSVHCFEDLTNEIYSVTSGWQHYDFEYEGRMHKVMRSFPIDARSICEVYWSPNHVRAWRREVYEKIGGHSGQLRVGDDHDLMCRTYLSGCKFVHIEKPLYFYRRFKESRQNTFVVENALVQQQQFRNRDKYLYPLIFEWCRRENKLMLDLGGAHNCPKHLGFKSVDLHDADFICDVTKGIPVEDNSVGCFRAQDFLEHIPILEMPKLMNQLYDKLAPGGWIISATPSVTDNEGKVGRGAFQDPTHIAYYSPNNFWYYTRKDKAKYVPEIRCRFQEVRNEIIYPDDWHRKNFIPYVIADLYCVKDQRVPGLQLI